MSKRFPIPAFDRDRYKNMDWREPAPLPPQEQERLVAAARSGSTTAYGAYPVAAPAAFNERFGFRGDHCGAFLCLMPASGVHLVGRSYAWAIQRALVVDSLDAVKASVLFDWKTPRPMNTRLGPDEGATIDGGVAYVVCSHRYADYWIPNRMQAGERMPGGAASGFAVLSASDDEINDFHACNVAFSWT